MISRLTLPFRSLMLGNTGFCLSSGTFDKTCSATASGALIKPFLSLPNSLASTATTPFVGIHWRGGILFGFLMSGVLTGATGVGLAFGVGVGLTMTVVFLMIVFLMIVVLL